jgi:hypothetical protein
MSYSHTVPFAVAHQPSTPSHDIAFSTLFPIPAYNANSPTLHRELTSWLLQEYIDLFPTRALSEPPDGTQGAANAVSHQFKYRPREFTRLAYIPCLLASQTSVLSERFYKERLESAMNPMQILELALWPFDAGRCQALYSTPDADMTTSDAYTIASNTSRSYTAAAPKSLLLTISTLADVSTRKDFGMRSVLTNWFTLAELLTLTICLGTEVAVAIRSTRGHRLLDEIPQALWTQDVSGWRAPDTFVRAVRELLNIADPRHTERPQPPAPRPHFLSGPPLRPLLSVSPHFLGGAAPSVVPTSVGTTATISTSIPVRSPTTAPRTPLPGNAVSLSPAFQFVVPGATKAEKVLPPPPSQRPVGSRAPAPTPTAPHAAPHPLSHSTTSSRIEPWMKKNAKTKSRNPASSEDRDASSLKRPRASEPVSPPPRPPQVLPSYLELYANVSHGPEIVPVPANSRPQSPRLDGSIFHELHGGAPTPGQNTTTAWPLSLPSSPIRDSSSNSGFFFHPTFGDGGALTPRTAFQLASVLIPPAPPGFNIGDIANQFSQMSPSGQPRDERTSSTPQ